MIWMKDMVALLPWCDPSEKYHSYVFDRWRSPAPGSAGGIRKLDELTTDLKGVQPVTDDALFSAEETP